jgi:GTP-binding protein
MFVDEAKILVKGGNGGNGCVSMHREKFIPKGGPDGGDGGKGGDVVVEADGGLKTLLDFQWRRHYKADRGRHGEGSNRHGKNGADLILKVPVGTVAKDEDGRVLGELLAEGEKMVVATGGQGGRGNAAFATPIHKAPGFAEKGEPGEEKTIFFELKLLADVGLVGYPNAGKSTLIGRISAAKPKIASYPFTTLKPNLGVVSLDSENVFVVADIPGLIEGAHQGKGLGDRFLRHLERTAVLLHLLDMSGVEREDPVTDYETIRRELEKYGAELADRPEIIVGTKIDLPEAAERAENVKRWFAERGHEFFAVSAVTGEGIKELLYATAELVRSEREKHPPQRIEPTRLYRMEKEEEIKIERLSAHSWAVHNPKVRRLVRMTNFENEEAIDYLRRKLAKFGVDDELKKAGAVPGDEVVIGEIAFEYQ